MTRLEEADIVVLLHGFTGKISAEELVRNLSERGLPALIIEPTIIYGPYSGEWSIHPLRILHQANYALPPGGLCNPVYVDDVVTAVGVRATPARNRRALLCAAHESGLDPKCPSLACRCRGASRFVGRSLVATGVRFTDLTGAFATHAEAIYTDSCCHVNARGNAIVADLVLDAIRRDVEPSPAPPRRPP
jgi:hypothetical protein